MVDSIKAFGALLTELWQTGLDGFGVSNALIALAVFLVFAIFRGLFARFVVGGFKRLALKSETKVDDMLVEALAKPLKFFFVVIGFFFATEVFALSGSAAEIIANVNRTLISFGFFWFLYSATEPFTHSMRRLETMLTSEIVHWLSTVVKWGIVATGIATLLQIWGIQIAPIIAGFGLFGVAVALGAQDLFRNLLAGVSILVEQRFRIGDWVLVDGVVEGTVEHIGFRSTRLRRFDKAPVTVPNNVFSDHAVTNFSAMSHRRIFWRIGLEYRSSSELLLTIRQKISQWLLDNPNFVNPPELPCYVFIDQFSDSSIDILLYTFTVTTDWEEWLQQKQDLAVAIKNIVEDAGGSFAFPSRTMYVEPTGAFENFIPDTQSNLSSQE
jgi:MscS family membrane protein